MAVWRISAILVALTLATSGPQIAPAADNLGHATSHTLVVRLTPEAFAGIADKRIDRVTSVSEEILGTQIRGTAHVTGQPQVQLIEDPDQAGFKVILTGMTHSRTKGYNGPVVLHSHSTTQFRAVKHVAFVPGEGFRAGPATVEGKTQTVTDDIQANRGGLIGRIIRRKAWERVAASRAEGERIAFEKTSRRVSALFDEYLEARLDRINKTYALREAVAVIRGTGVGPVFSCCTTSEHMLIAAARGQCELSSLKLPQLHGASPPIQVWLQTSTIGGSMGKALVDSLRTGKRAMDWFERTVALRSLDNSSLLSIPPETPPLPFQVDSAGDWLVLQFGDRQPELVAQRDR